MKSQDEFIENIEQLKKSVDIILQNRNTADNKDKERFLKELEKTRYALFSNVKLNNKFSKNKIDYINNQYKATSKQGVLKINVPEVLPRYKNISNPAYKNIMLNVAEITKPFKEMFNDKFTFVIIVVNETQKNMDIDNKFVKPIIDGLVISRVVKDDNFNNIFYAALGRKSTTPSTEVYVMEGKLILNWIEEIEKSF